MDNHNPLDINVFDIFSRTATNPSAGANFSLAVLPRAREQLIYISFKLITDANAANRLIQIGALINSIPFYTSNAGTAEIASRDYDYYFNIGIGSSFTGGSTDDVNAPLNAQFFLEDDDTITITITDIQVGDQISDIRLVSKLWMIDF